VLATVVSVRRPASAKRGDRALVRADGKLVGWVGGACSEPAVIREAVRALADGEPRLLRICPPGSAVDQEGVVIAESACASEGTVEVLIEPHLPVPLVAVVGESPAAVALRELLPGIGWRVTSDLEAGADAVVLATMGRGDEDGLEAALASPAGYVGLVASSRRAAVVLEGCARAASARKRWLGSAARPASIWGRSRSPRSRSPSSRSSSPGGMRAPARRPSSAEAVDPVCGMTVAVGPDTPQASMPDDVLVLLPRVP
jgi:xanthine dehydrogenase accessory factor